MEVMTTENETLLQPDSTTTTGLETEIDGGGGDNNRRLKPGELALVSVEEGSDDEFVNPDAANQGEEVDGDSDPTDENPISDLSLTPTERNELFSRQDRVLSAELQIESLKEDTKTAKDELKTAQKSLRTYIIELREKDRARQGGVVEDSQQSTAAPATLTPTSWRAVPLSTLEIPDYLLEKLAEHSITTFGALEDLRGDISSGRAKWPKGVGEAKVTLLVDAGMKFWVDHPEYLAAANGEVVEGGDETIAADQRTEVAGGNEIETPPPGGTQPPPAEPISIEDRAEEIKALECNTSDHVYTPKLPNTTYFESGAEAATRGWYLADCAWVEGEERDDWVRGFLSATGDE